MAFTGPAMFRTLKSLVMPTVRLTIRPQSQHLLKTVSYPSYSATPLLCHKKYFSVSISHYQQESKLGGTSTTALATTNNKKKTQRKRRTIMDQDDSSPSSPVR